MKRFGLAAIALLLALMFAAAPNTWAAGNVVTVATTAGGTSTVPAGGGYVLFLTNTGSNVVDCIINGGSGGVVSASNWNFQLQPSGGTWMAPTITYAPNQIGIGSSARIAGVEGITCIAISSSSTVTWYRR
jgi:hypothetical protein